MEKEQLSEQIVDSILDGNKESFMAAFQAAIAAKVTDALEVKKVEIASSLIAPEMAVEEEVDLEESKGEMEDDEEEDDEEEDEDSEDMKEEVEQVDETYKSAIKHIKKYDYDKAVNALKHDPKTQKEVKKHLNAAVRHQDKYYAVVDAMHKAGEKAASITRLSDKADEHEYNRQNSHNKALDLVHSKNNMSEEIEQVDEAKFSKKQTVMAHTIGKEFKKKGVGDASKGGPFAVATAMVRDRPFAAKKAYRTILTKKKK